MRRIFNFWKRTFWQKKEEGKPKFRTILELASTSPDGQASRESVSMMKSCLNSNPSEQECYDQLVEISKRGDISKFVATLCDVSEFYERPE